MSNEGRKRGKLFYCLVGTCLVLATLCASLVAVIVVLHHFYTCGSLSQDVHHTGPTQVATTRDLNPWAQDYRLPNDTIPLHYDVLLHPDIENQTFTGEVTIQIRVKTVRKFLVLNSKYLNIHDTKLLRANYTQVDIGEVFEYKPNEFWVVRTAHGQDLEPGIYTLAMKFNGSLSGKIVGFYRSVYMDMQTKQQRLVLPYFFNVKRLCSRYCRHWQIL